MTEWQFWMLMFGLWFSNYTNLKIGHSAWVIRLTALSAIGSLLMMVKCLLF